MQRQGEIFDNILAYAFDGSSVFVTSSSFLGLDDNHFWTILWEWLNELR
jgi:hypothetical protein